MRVTVSSGDRQVDIKAKGSGRKTLRRIERTAQRLLAQTPSPAPARPFGFSVRSETDLFDQDSDT